MADYTGISYEGAVGGPNAHLPLLSLVLLEGNLFMSFIYCFFAGMLVPIFKVLCYNKIKNLKAVGKFKAYHMVYIYLFFFYPAVLIDQNTFSYQLTSILISGIIFQTAISSLSILGRIMMINYSSKNDWFLRKDKGGCS
ncbi:MAG: hypothetical protein RMI01_07390 [Thermodesulfovibrio sp.]|nr:hypothetical protein [Thermodesulfovibrio sp.]